VDGTGIEPVTPAV